MLNLNRQRQKPQILSVGSQAMPQEPQAAVQPIPQEQEQKREPDQFEILAQMLDDVQRQLHIISSNQVALNSQVLTLMNEANTEVDVDE